VWQKWIVTRLQGVNPVNPRCPPYPRIPRSEKFLKTICGVRQMWWYHAYTLYTTYYYIYRAVAMPEAYGISEECRSENNSVVFFQSVFSSSSCVSLFFSVRIDIAGAAGDFIPVTRSNLHMSIYPRGGIYYILCYIVANIYIYTTQLWSAAESSSTDGFIRKLV